MTKLNSKKKLKKIYILLRKKFVKIDSFFKKPTNFKYVSKHSFHAYIDQEKTMHLAMKAKQEFRLA